MTEPNVPTPEQVAADNAAATAKAADNLSTQIDSLAKQIESGTLRLREASDRVSAPQVVQPVAAAPLTEAELTKIADERGVGAAITEHIKRVEAPAFMSLLSQNANLQRKNAERDPMLGKVLKKYGKEVEAKIRELGINDAYLAEKGYDSIVKLVAAENDPALLMPDAPAPTAPAPAPKAPAAPAAPAPVIVAPLPSAEGVYNGPVVSTPAPNRSVEDEIRAVPVERREVDFVRDVFDMTEADLKKQRYEMQQNTKKYGEDGLKRIGGMPICTFGDIGFPEPR
jgi:2-oxoglutarate dehydrogenase E2 component (dihydrolipoamide succinyltransferase)